MDWIGSAIGVAGLAPTVGVGIDRARVRIPHRRALNFTSSRGIEIIVTTSTTRISSVGPADDEQKRARRHLTPSGDLAGVAEICTMLSRTYRRRPWIITPSAKTRDDSLRDLILVGGPIHNHFTSRMISENRYSDDEIVFDANGRYIRVGENEFGPDLDLNFKMNVPSFEYCIILLSEVRNLGRNQRVVAIGGLTTYGTHAGCRFVASDLPHYLKREGFGKRPNVCVLVKAAIVNEQPYDIQPVCNLLLDQTGARA